MKTYQKNWIAFVFCATTLYSATALSGTEGVSEFNTNLRSSPFLWKSGLANADVDFVVGKKFTLGPSFSMLHSQLLTTELRGFGLSVRGNYYFGASPIVDSWYLGPSIGFSTAKVSLGEDEGSTSGLYLGTLLGYQWVWKSGFNVNFAAGVSYYGLASHVDVSRNSQISTPIYSGVLPTAELTVGYAL